MPAVTPLSAAERAEALAQLPHWRFDEGRKAIHRQLVFADFAAALGFMVQVGVAAEKQDHHPEWANVYNRVDIWLTTHDAGGVSARDVRLARHIDALAG